MDLRQPGVRPEPSTKHRWDQAPVHKPFVTRLVLEGAAGRHCPPGRSRGGSLGIRFSDILLLLKIMAGIDALICTYHT